MHVFLHEKASHVRTGSIKTHVEVWIDSSKSYAIPRRATVYLENRASHNIGSRSRHWSYIAERWRENVLGCGFWCSPLTFEKTVCSFTSNMESAEPMTSQWRHVTSAIEHSSVTSAIRHNGDTHTQKSYHKICRVATISSRCECAA